MKKLTRSEMKNVVGGANGGSSNRHAVAECATNCHPGFVSMECSGKCTTTDDVGIKCGTVTKCCYDPNCSV